MSSVHLESGHRTIPKVLKFEVANVHTNGCKSLIELRSLILLYYVCNPSALSHFCNQLLKIIYLLAINYKLLTCNFFLTNTDFRVTNQPSYPLLSSLQKNRRNLSRSHRLTRGLWGAHIRILQTCFGYSAEELLYLLNKIIRIALCRDERMDSVNPVTQQMTATALRQFQSQTNVLSTRYVQTLLGNYSTTFNHNFHCIIDWVLDVCYCRRVENEAGFLYACTSILERSNKIVDLLF